MKKTKIIFWVSTVFIFLFEGIMPMGTVLFAPQYVNVGTQPLGYPDYFAVALTICKFIGALAILLPVVPARVKEWAYAGLTFNLIFASMSHAVVGGNAGFIILPLVIMFILALSYFSQHRVEGAQSRVANGGTELQGLATA